jgi:6-phosphogluconolactonase (cycloisomerase 2 family)
MRTRFTWLAGFATLISIGVLVACSSKYSTSNNGLVVLSTQGNAVMESFSLDLTDGKLAQINNVNGPPTSGYGTTVVLDPAGAFAYVLMAQNSTVSGSSTGVQVFPIASDGKLGAGSGVKGLNPSLTGTAPCVTTVNNQQVTTYLSVNVTAPVIPISMAMDSAGKLMFLPDASTNAQATYMCNGASVTGTAVVSGAVSVFAVSNGTLSEVPGSPFTLPPGPMNQLPSPSALAVTPTAFPPAYAICSGNVAPTAEYLYVTDNLNYVVDLAAVSSAGALSWNVSQPATGTSPAGVTVDPCNRFVYVSNSQPSNTVSAYTICNNISYPDCPLADYSLLPVSGSPFPAGLAPGPLLMDAYAGFLYVLNTQSNTISAYGVSTTTGSLTPLTPPTIATNTGGAPGYSAPTSIAIRNDDSWMFVTNFNSANLSVYGITPKTGALTPQPPGAATFNYPWGVAVK